MKRLILGLVLVSATSAGGASAADEAEGGSVALEGSTGAAGGSVESELAAEPEPTPAPVAAPVPAVAAPAPVAPIPLTSLPPTQRYREHQAPPPGYVLEEQARRGLVISGAAVVGALYLTGVITTGVLQSFPNKTGYLAVPVAGPWITLVTRDTSCIDDDDTSIDCEGDQAVDRLLVLDGLLQAVGTGLLVTGLTWTKSIWVREDLANINIVPGLNVARLPGMPEPQGLSLVGQF